MLSLPEEVARDCLISDEYRKQQELLHRDPLYGHAAEDRLLAKQVADLLNRYQIDELLDYGAGKGFLAKTIIQHNLVDHRLRIQQYDPAVPRWAAAPEPCDFVTCVDVL